MKKFIIVLVLVFVVISGQVYAQAAVADAIVSSLLTSMGINQFIYYAQSLEQFVQQAALLADQVKTSVEMAKRATQNLQSAENIKSLDDFKNWYNRQLYLEHETMDKIKSWNISIGNKQYSFWDIENIIDGLEDTYVEYWNREFTEEQQREMWINLGLTPSNYAYRQIFQGNLRHLQRQFLTASEIRNDEYMSIMEHVNEIMEELANDKNLDTDDKMGEKEILMYQLEMTMMLNKQFGNIGMDIAKILEFQANKNYLEQTPVDAPVISDWPDDGFGPLKSTPVYY